MSVQISPQSKMLVLLSASLLLAGVANAGPIFHGIDPTATFLRTDSTDVTVGPVFINLSAYGVSPGMTIYLQTLGDLCTNSGALCPQTALPLVVTFTEGTTVGAVSLLERLTAIGPPLGITSVSTPNTWYQNLTTDIAQDFAVPIAGFFLVVPDGANYLAVGVSDVYYADNTDPDRNYGILLDGEPIPEPGTLFLLASGLGLLLVGMRRKRST